MAAQSEWPNFFDLSYLVDGSAIQRAGHNVIQRSGILTSFARYQPVLAGTLPLDLYTPTSDLDILCYADNLSDFEKNAAAKLHLLPNFTSKKISTRGVPAIVVSFVFQEFKFELFAQSIPVHYQMAYRHMVVEYRILQKKGPAFRDQIFHLKLSGLTTEHAFAHALQLPGDPYLALLAYFPEE